MTITDLFDFEITKQTDRVSVLPTLLRNKQNAKHELLMWKFPDNKRQTAIITGD